MSSAQGLGNNTPANVSGGSPTPQPAATVGELTINDRVAKLTNTSRETRTMIIAFGSNIVETIADQIKELEKKPSSKTLRGRLNSFSEIRRLRRLEHTIRVLNSAAENTNDKDTKAVNVLYQKMKEKMEIIRALNLPLESGNTNRLETAFTEKGEKFNKEINAFSKYIFDNIQGIGEKYKNRHQAEEAVEIEHQWAAPWNRRADLRKLKHKIKKTEDLSKRVIGYQAKADMASLAKSHQEMESDEALLFVINHRRKYFQDQVQPKLTEFDEINFDELPKAYKNGEAKKFQKKLADLTRFKRDYIEPIPGNIEWWQIELRNYIQIPTLETAKKLMDAVAYVGEFTKELREASTDNKAIKNSLEKCLSHQKKVSEQTPVKSKKETPVKLRKEHNKLLKEYNSIAAARPKAKTLSELKKLRERSEKLEAATRKLNTQWDSIENALTNPERVLATLSNNIATLEINAGSQMSYAGSEANRSAAKETAEILRKRKAAIKEAAGKGIYAYAAQIAGINHILIENKLWAAEHKFAKNLSERQPENIQDFKDRRADLVNRLHRQLDDSVTTVGAEAAWDAYIKDLNSLGMEIPKIFSPKS